MKVNQMNAKHSKIVHRNLIIYYKPIKYKLNAQNLSWEAVSGFKNKDIFLIRVILHILL